MVGRICRGGIAACCVVAAMSPPGPNQENRKKPKNTIQGRDFFSTNPPRGPQQHNIGGAPVRRCYLPRDSAGDAVSAKVGFLALRLSPAVMERSMRACRGRTVGLCGPESVFRPGGGVAHVARMAGVERAALGQIGARGVAEANQKPGKGESRDPVPLQPNAAKVRVCKMARDLALREHRGIIVVRSRVAANASIAFGLLRQH